MLPALALIVACSAGVPTGVDTGSNPADAPVIVNPRSLVLEANQVSIFKAYAHGVPGDSLVTSIEWTATGGNISLNGTYSSASTGDFKIVGKRHGPNVTTSDTAIVTVVPPQPSITAVVISPGTASVAAGKQQTFNAIGTLSDSTTVAIGVTWTATGGSIDAGGVYTAGSTPGTFKVIAKAASANVADTVPVSVTAAPPPPPQGSGSFPNLPSGYTVPSGYVDDFNASSVGIFSPMYTIGIRDASTYSPSGVAAPRNAPTSPSGIGEALYPAGFSSSGIAPGIVWSNDFTGNGWSGLYLSFTVQLSSNWVSHSSGVNKVVIANIDGHPMFVASAANGSYWQMRLQDLEADPKGAARNLEPNLASAPVTKGLWQRVEVQLVANTPGQANGVVRVWLTSFGSDGSPVSGPTKVTEYTNVGWVASGHSTSWNKASWNPIWGGTGGANVPVQQYMWMDQLAIGGN
jgi:hypothetical protein